MIDQVYQNLYKMDLLTYEVDFPTIMDGLLLVRCITILVTSNTLTKVTANHIIDQAHRNAWSIPSE